MMRANNPVLSDKNFQEKAAGEGWVAPQQGAFDAGSSSTREATQGRRMTIGGSMTATGVLLVLLVASGAFGWSQVDQSFQTINNPNGTVTVVNNSTAPWWIWAGMFGAFVLGMITVFVPKAARFTAPVYCLAYGMGLGAISAFFNGMWNGIVAQAVLVTMGVVVVMFLLYALRIVKVTPKLVIGIIAATGGVFLMYLVAWIGSLFGANLYFWNNPTPLGIGVSVLICGIAAFNLLLDFDFIERASKEGYPAYMEWYAAFGLTVTIIWLYISVLRLLALLNQR
ncbi:MAG: Bax inhibitor-1/YccA family protein [Acidimicrobiales bacterium]